MSCKLGCVTILSIFACIGSPCQSRSGAAHPLDDLQAGYWYEAPDSKLETVFPDHPPQGNSGPGSVMDAWSGGAFDTLRNRLIVWGGGHMDYSGNEIYVFDTDALTWTRLTNPTPNSGIITNAAHYADGRPSARHTYNYLQYCPRIDSLVSLGYSASYGDQSTSGDDNAVDAFDFHAALWESKAPKPSDGYTIGSISAYDPSTGKLWHHGCLSNEAGLTAYDPVTDSWSGPYGASYIEYYATAAIDPTRHIMVATGGSANNKVVVWDLDRPGNAREVSTSGDRTLESAQAPGFIYDPVIDTFVGWRGGASVYTLNSDTWVWTRVDPAPSNSVSPTAPNANGTYGRFQYIPSKNLYVVVNRADEDVYFYKLSAASSAPSQFLKLRPDSDGKSAGTGGGAIEPGTLVAVLLAFGLKASRSRKLSRPAEARCATC